MKRRKFMTTVGGISAATAAGAFSILKHPRHAAASGWGTWPEDKLDALLEPSLRASSILELHVNGGLGAFDSFYTVPSWGEGLGANPAGQVLPRFLWTFSETRTDIGDLGDNALETRFAQCGGPGATMWSPFGATDRNGVDVYLGPWAYPFWSRPDILDRMRVVVMRHSGVAHEAANPLSFTGTELGQPRMAGVGTAIQRYFNENPDVPGGGGIRAAPYAYVLYPSGYKPFNAVSASAVGFHPGSAKPLVVSVDPNSELSQLLTRDRVDNATFDRALDYYRSTYNARMRTFGHSAETRSAERANFEFASFARHNATALTEILRDELFGTIQGSGCGLATQYRDTTRMSLNMAANLLTRTTDAARYVMVIDSGLNPSPTGGHDVHGNSVSINGLNVPNTFQALLDIIATPEQVANGEADGMINLDETMVVINTEFGRTPFEQVGPPNPRGTNHWPQGYVNVFIGGPVQGRSVYGAINPNDGMSQTYVSPAENRMMMLQAMGIYPFSSQSYAVADVRGVADDDPDGELLGAARIRDTYLLGND